MPDTGLLYIIAISIFSTGIVMKCFVVNDLPGFLHSVHLLFDMVNLQDTFGAAFIGGMIAAIMYGITVLQTYMYYVHYPRDNMSTKLLTHYTSPSVTSFGNMDALQMTEAAVYIRHRENVRDIVAVPLMICEILRCGVVSRSSIRWWLTCSIMLIVIAHFCTVPYSNCDTEQLTNQKHSIWITFNTTFDALQQGILYPVMPFTITAFLSDLCTTIALIVSAAEITA
ncbi:hypothetical protein K503DRAFT_785038, partial [Rhizopogon vinicolor AM-OR11-026]